MMKATYEWALFDPTGIPSQKITEYSIFDKGADFVLHP